MGDGRLREQRNGLCGAKHKRLQSIALPALSKLISLPNVREDVTSRRPTAVHHCAEKQGIVFNFCKRQKETAIERSTTEL
jgi:hypothetical protein